MQITPNEFVITKWNPSEILLGKHGKRLLELDPKIDLTYKISRSNDVPIIHLIIIGIFKLININGGDELLNYTAEKDYYVNIENWDKEKDETKKSVYDFLKNFEQSFKTKTSEIRLRLNFPKIEKASIEVFCQKIIRHFHKPY